MTVYIINNMDVHNQDEYKAYLRGFMPVFQQYGGTVLAAQDNPVPVEGEWPYQRTILLSFPTRELAELWAASPDYARIAVHRRAGTDSNVVFLDGFAPPA